MREAGDRLVVDEPSQDAGQEQCSNRAPAATGKPISNSAPDRTNAILVTGSHRSGSTWVGSALGLADGVSVIREPFHPLRRQSWVAGHVDRWFLHVDDESPIDLRQALERMVSGRPPIGRHIASIRSPRHAAATVRDLAKLAGTRARGDRLLFKDPIAFFAAEHLADALGVEVTVLVRHPAAFAGSLKRLDWQFDFANLRDQTRLIDGRLAPFASEIDKAVSEPGDVIDQAILLWRIFAAVAGQWREDRSDFVVARYEDIAADPIAGLGELYVRHGLNFGEAQRRAVEEMTSAEHGTDVGNPLEVRRDSRRAAWTWTSRLDAAEIARVRAGTADIAVAFYGDDDWRADD